MITTETAGSRKARGAFYTPNGIASFLANWAITSDTKRVLEPSAGDGSFVEAAARRLRDVAGPSELVAVELVDAEGAIAAARGAAQGVATQLVVRDFFEVDASELGAFDVVVGNPPWIRYHHFKADQRERARSRAEEMGVRLSRLSSSWAPYLVHATSFLTATGRMAMVLPAELMQVDYARDVRRFLSERFSSLHLVGFEGQVFGDAEVDALLLLASQDGEPGVTFERVRTVGEIGSAERVSLSHTGRWASALVPRDAQDLLAELETSKRLVRLGTVASVDIGIVTGFNDFFVLSDAEVRDFGVRPDQLRPIVTRSDQLLDGVVTADHFSRWRTEGRKTQLVVLERDSASSVGRYLRRGKTLGAPARYKCRTRTPWYSVPLKPAPDLFLSYMAHVAPRVALNEAGALSTNLIHGMYLHDPEFGPAIAASWDNPATLLSAELEGRAYGGGVLKLETREAERVLVPNPRIALGLSSNQASILTRALDARRSSRMRSPRRP